MAISYVGGASGITSATLPTHQVGDLIIAFAFRDGSTAIPALGFGFTSTTTRTGTFSSCIVGFRRATATNTATGTWTNATSVIFVIYRDVGSIGGTSVDSGSSTTINYPALTLTNQTGSSWVAGFAGHRSTNVAIQTAPTGMVNRISVSDATDEAAAHDTNSGFSSFTSRTASVGGTSSGWVSATIELIDGSATAIATGIQSLSSFDSVIARIPITKTITGQQLIADNLLIPTESNWYAWTFGYRTVGFLANANISQNGISATSSFNTITATGEQNVLIGINGIQATSSLETISAIGQQFAEIAINGIDLLVNLESINAIGSGIIELETILSTTETENITANGSSFVDVVANELISSFGSIAITVDDIQLVNGITIQSNIETIFAIGNATKDLNGIDLNANFGDVTAQGAEVQNATIAINGLNLTLNISPVSAQVDSPQTFAGGAVKRYPANAFKNASIKISGITANLAQNTITAIATSQINATIMLDNVVSFTQIANINAEGVLSINDEELILLMAA